MSRIPYSDRKFSYVVQGRFGFPTDMLRYDRAYPADSDSAGAIYTSIEEYRTRETRGVFSIKVIGIGYPTVDRWSSFGWSVVPESITDLDADEQVAA